VLFSNGVLAAMMFGRKYNVIPQKGDCSRKAMCVLWFVETNATSFQSSIWKTPPSFDAIRRFVQQFQETGGVLYRKGTGRLSTSQEDVDRIQKGWTSYVPRKVRMLKLFSILQH
jgi:hypothetical protein